MPMNRRNLRVFVCAIACALAGRDAEAQISLGVKGGVNFSDLAIKNDELSLNTRIAPNLGVIFNYPVTPTFSIQAEPGFSSRGGKIKEETVTDLAPGVPVQVVTRSVMKLSYFELPVMAQYRPYLTEKLQAIISVGPEVRLRVAPQKLKGKSEFYLNGELAESHTQHESASDDEGVGKFDVGLAFGAGAAYPVGRFTVFAEARYHLGLYNVVSHIDTNTKAFNRGASVALGVTVPILNK